LTTDQFIAKLQRQIDAINKDDIPLQKGVRNVMALQSKRIFLDALNADGGIIGSYKNPNATYVNPVTLKSQTNLPAGFPTKGKNGETKFKNGNPHKTGYFPNFLAFKKAVGRNKRVETVDLFLTGTLHRHWANGDSFSKAEARRVNQHNYIVGISEADVKKVARYNRVFNLSLSERKIFLSTVKNELFKALK